MSNFSIGQGLGSALGILVWGKDSTNTHQGLSAISASLDDASGAYLVDGGGGGTFSLIPRQNTEGGTPLGATITVTLSVSGKSLDGTVIPASTYTIEINPPAPATPQSVSVGVQQATIVTLNPIPPDTAGVTGGAVTINVTP